MAAVPVILDAGYDDAVASTIGFVRSHPPNCRAVAFPATLVVIAHSAAVEEGMELARRWFVIPLEEGP